MKVLFLAIIWLDHYSGVYLLNHLCKTVIEVLDEWNWTAQWLSDASRPFSGPTPRFIALSIWILQPTDPRKTSAGRQLRLASTPALPGPAAAASVPWAGGRCGSCVGLGNREGRREVTSFCLHCCSVLKSKQAQWFSDYRLLFRISWRTRPLRSNWEPSMRMSYLHAQ